MISHEKRVDFRDQMAAMLRSRGWNPIPSREDKKQPPCRYSHLWEKLAPWELFGQYPTTNIQLMTGRFWRLLVIDLDGPQAREEWAKMPPKPRTWITHSGGNGQHWWFTLPPEYPDPLPLACLWLGDGDHSRIDRICDRSLIVVPPSVHPVSGKTYQFLAHHGPKNIPVPAQCPDWVLKMKPVKTSEDVAPYVPPTPQQRSQILSGRYHTADDVIAAIPDKIALVQSWGLRITGTAPTHNGFMECRGYDRQDNDASAAIHVDKGFYTDRGGVTTSLFGLAVAMGIYGSRGEAISALGDEFIGKIPDPADTGHPKSR